MPNIKLLTPFLKIRHKAHSLSLHILNSKTLPNKTASKTKEIIRVVIIRLIILYISSNYLRAYN